MHTKAIGIRAALGGAALALLAAIALAAPAQAGEDQEPLSITPLPAVGGQTLTITPANASGACDRSLVDLLYYDYQFNQDPRPITLDPEDASDDMWADHLAFDAGQYRVLASCMDDVQENAGHRTARQIAGFFYETRDFQVDGLLSGPDTALVGQGITYGPADHSLCPDGTIDLTITNPDGSVTVPLGPTVDADGKWSSAHTFNAPGTYQLGGACHVERRPSAGHLAASGILQSDVLFTYRLHPVVVTAPVETPPATPVVAAADFTG